MRYGKTHTTVWAFAWAGFLIALLAAPALGLYEINVVPNPRFAGTGGTQVGSATGDVPDAWRGFGVNGGAIETSIVALPADALYAGSPATNAVRIEVTAFGQDQGFDHNDTRMVLIPGQSYHAEFYVKTGNADDSDQSVNFGFPLFGETGYLARSPGDQSGITATDTWTKVTAPTFTDAEAIAGFLAFRLGNDGGENAVLIAAPEVVGPPDRLMPPDAAALAQRDTWTTGDKLVGASYFYWYRWPDRGFFNDAAMTDDALTHHFVDPESVSMLSKDWHKKEASDAIDAGLDMLWPVYWGYPAVFETSTYVAGLYPLQDALDELETEGRTPPKLGMFYDTTTLRNKTRWVEPLDGLADLTAFEGKDLFYRTIRSFFCAVHPRHWACIDGRPVVVLYKSGFVSDYDQTTIDYLNASFASDFGGLTPYVIRDASWDFATDSEYLWGATVNGPTLYDTAGVGPGYDDTAVPDRCTPIRLREDGNYYRWGWHQVLQAGVDLVHVETWNEMFEGTEICESLEFGRQYINLTAFYISHFKAGTIPDETIELEYPDPMPPQPDMQEGTEYADVFEVSITAENDDLTEAGLTLTTGIGDGPVSIVEYNGDTYMRTDPSPFHYAYFKIADPFYYDQHRRAVVTIEYLDEGTGWVQLQYDSYDPAGVFDGSYTNADSFPLTDTGSVLTYTDTLDDTRFRNRQHLCSDFRYLVSNGPLHIKSVSVDVLPLPAPVMNVINTTPAPAATVTATLRDVELVLGYAVDASTVHDETCTLLAAGSNGTFDDVDDTPIPATIIAAGNTITLDLAGATLPAGDYRLTLAGRGIDPVLDINGQVLDGKFDGTLPSGDGTGGDDFVATFTLAYANADFEPDGDVDADDLSRFIGCATGPAIPYDPMNLPPGCQLSPDADGLLPADFDADGDVDMMDFSVLQRSFGR